MMDEKPNTLIVHVMQISFAGIDAAKIEARSHRRKQREWQRAGWLLSINADIKL